MVIHRFCSVNAWLLIAYDMVFYAIIKVNSPVANLRKTMIYITNVDLVHDYVYTKFGLTRSIEQKLNSDVNQGR